MRETLYLADDIAIINYDKTFPTTKSGLIKSEEFHQVMSQFLHTLKEKDAELYDWAAGDREETDAVRELCRLARTIIVFDMDERSTARTSTERTGPCALWRPCTISGEIISAIR